MANNTTHDDYLKNYFNERSALLLFGERFIKDVFDPSIERFLNAYDGKGNPQFVEAIKKYTETFSDEQMDALKKSLRLLYILRYLPCWIYSSSDRN